MTSPSNVAPSSEFGSHVTTDFWMTPLLEAVHNLRKSFLVKLSFHGHEVRVRLVIPRCSITGRAWLLLFCLLCSQAALLVLRAQTAVAAGQDEPAEVRVPRLFEEFPWSLSKEERAFVARNLDQAFEIGVSYESQSTRPLRITSATARSVEIFRPTGVTPLYVVALSFRVENTTNQSITAFACSLFRVGFEGERIPLRLHRSIPARGSREFSIPSVASPLHLGYMPIILAERPTALGLNIDGVSFAGGTSWGTVPRIETQPPKVSRTRPILDDAHSQANRPIPPERIQLGKNLLEAHLVKRVNPIYPQAAKEAGIQDIVLLQVTIGRNGQVAGVQVSQGHPLLIEAAQDAVRQWTYQPIWINGQPVEVVGPVEVRFKSESAQ